MTIKSYSTTSSNNTSVNSSSLAEGQLPSTLNNSVREITKDIRDGFNSKEWFELGTGDQSVTWTRGSATTITVSADITTSHHVGRRVRVTGSNSGVLYGFISASAYSSPNTTLTFTFDSGSINSGDSTLTSVEVGSPYNNPANPVINTDALSEDSNILPPSQSSVKNFVTSGTATLSNKSINLANNTLSGNLSQFNSALSGEDFASLTGSETLTNKTLTSPTISQITNSGTITLPTSSDTLVGRATTDTLTNKTISLANNTFTGTLAQLQSAVSDATLVDLDDSQTLTNKTLTSPVISTISNTGTLTLPTSTDTLIGRATTDTLNNKTLATPVINQISNTGTLSLPTSTDTLVGKATTDTLTNKTISGSSNTLSNIATSSLSGTISNSQLGGSISTDKIGDSQITTSKINNDAITIDKIADAVIVTNSEASSHSVDDNTFFTTSASDNRYFRQDSTETISSGATWSSSDNFIATTGAIDARVIDLVDDVGGFVPIANETSFPNANPDVNNGAGTIVSIKALSGSITANGSGVITIANGTVGNSTVTLNGLSASQTLGSGFGILVETTSTLNTYTFHREIAPATSTSSLAGVVTEIGRLGTTDAIADMNTLGTTANVTAMSNVSGSISNVNSVASGLTNVNTVATNISGVNSFGERYRVASSAPTSSLDVGDLYFDSTANILKVYGASGWQSAGSSVNGTSDRFKFTVSGTPTTLTGNDDNSETLSYDAGFIDVYLNGVRMINGVDVTVTSGSSLVFANSLANGDIVEAVAFGTFSVASLNASNIDSGTLNNARLPSTISDKTINASALTAKGDGSSADGFISLNCSQNSHGVKVASPPHSASQSYTIKLPDNQIAQNKFMKVKSISGSGATAIGQLEFADVDLANLSASNLTSGTVPTARLGSGTASSSTFLAGDQTFKTITGTTINNNANNRLITGSGTANTLEGEADLTFDGTNLDLIDNKKIRFGTGNDLEIYHNGSHSIIEDVGTGKLEIRSNGTGVDIQKENAEFMARFITDGAVELYHDHSKKFETTSGGATVTGSLGIGDSSPLGKVHINTGGSATSVNGNADELVLEGSGNSGMTIISGNSSTSTIFMTDPDDTNIGAIQYEHNLNQMDFKVNDAYCAQFDSNGHFLPHSNNSFDLGSTSKVWRNIYTSDLNMSNEYLDKGNDVDGTKGSWTFQEGSDDLFLLNNKNGKKYKFKLEECK